MTEALHHDPIPIQANPAAQRSPGHLDVTVDQLQPAGPGTTHRCGDHLRLPQLVVKDALTAQAG